jgi:tungstate transport system substrate-binding protein
MCINRSRPFRSAVTILLLSCLLTLALSACSQTSPTPEPLPPTSPEIILATTTSTQDSGLLDVLIPVFEQKSGYTVKTVAVGSGQALKMAEQGNADVLLVHSPAAEKALIANSFGIERQLVMHNDFVIVGPPPDPAKIREAQLAVEALQKIAAASAGFISRGDDSGTHKMELSLWQQASLTPEGAWYQESGQGMGATLKIASEKEAYTLTDRATYLANRATLDLAILFAGDKALLNMYHVIVVNPAKWTKVNAAGARAFASFLLSPETQTLIGQFGVEKFGQSLFIPDAGKDEAEVGAK